MKRSFYAFTFVSILVGNGLLGQASQATQNAPTGAGFVTPSASQTATDAAKAPASFSPERQFRYAQVQAFMNDASPLKAGDGFFGQMGDETAFYIYTILGKRPPLSPGETQTVLDMVHKSFAIPGAIQNGDDRRPRKSLQLLKMLQATALDQLAKERIVAETTFLQTLPDKIAPTPLVNIPPKPGVMPNRADFPAAAKH